MWYVLDETTGMVMARLDEEFMRRAFCRPGTQVLAPTRDQCEILGVQYPLIPGWPYRVIHQEIPIGHARAIIALGDRQTQRWLKRKNRAGH